MTAQQYNQAVISVIELIVVNNAGGTARALKQAGYPIKDFIPESELKTALLQLHMSDRKKFFEVLNAIEWNYGNTNWTNDPKYRDKLINSLSKETGSPVAKGGFWGSLINALGQALVPTPSPLPPPVEQKIPVASYIILGLVVIGLIVTVVFGIKHLSKK